MNKLNNFLLLMSTLLFVSCASLNSVSMTSVPKERNNVVQASSSSYGFLGIFFSNDFAESVKADLQKKCPNGEIKGIMSTYQSYFYFIVLEREVTATGFCVEN